MDLECCHIVLNVADVRAAKNFYIHKLGLPVIEEYDGFFAVRAGDIRFSVFENGVRRDPKADADAPAVVILKTADLDATMEELRSRGVEFEADAREAPKLMRYAPLLDPDGHRLYIAQYFGDVFGTV